MDTVETVDTVDTAVAVNPNTVTLETPIVRGETIITKITLRKPRAGELRGISLNYLLMMDVDALQKIIPRVSLPTLTKAEMDALDPADLVQLGTVVSGFLLTTAERSAVSPSA